MTGGETIKSEDKRGWGKVKAVLLTESHFDVEPPAWMAGCDRGLTGNQAERPTGMGNQLQLFLRAKKITPDRIKNHRRAVQFGG